MLEAMAAALDCPKLLWKEVERIAGGFAFQASISLSFNKSIQFPLGELLLPCLLSSGLGGTEPPAQGSNRGHVTSVFTNQCSPFLWLR